MKRPRQIVGTGDVMDLMPDVVLDLDYPVPLPQLAPHQTDDVRIARIVIGIIERNLRHRHTDPKSIPRLERSRNEWRRYWQV